MSSWHSMATDSIAGEGHSSVCLDRRIVFLVYILNKDMQVPETSSYSETRVPPSAAEVDQVDINKPAMNLPTGMKQNTVPFHCPDLGIEEEREVLDTLRSGWLTTGPKTKRFERDFAAYVNAKHAIAVNSCTAALHLSLLAHDIGKDDEVITSPNTFAATVNVIEHVGAKPVFVDIEPETLNMDPSKLDAAVSTSTRAIIPVHFAGHPCDLDIVHAVASAHDLVVIEDAAHAIGASYRGEKIGGLSGVSTFSFYATKNMTTGEGGMITTNNDKLAQRMRILSLHGISIDAWKRYQPNEYKHWDILEPGYKYNMFDLQAALGLHQLCKLDGFIERRKHWTSLYDEGFADLPEMINLQCKTDVESAYHLYVVRFDTNMLGVSRDRLLEMIQQRGIGIGIHFRPVHLHPYYQKKYGYSRGDFPVSENAGDCMISLPLFPSLTKEQVDYVIWNVRDLITANRR